MLPGKKYQPEDYLYVVWARKWFLIVPTVVITSAVCVYSYFLPNRYRSTAMLQVIGQQVPENLVQSTVTDTVAERLLAIQQQIVSRTRLERIIDEFGLYAAERETRIMEDIVQQMRTRDLDITINTTARRADASSFNVSFTAEQPRTAMLVAERLAELFVDENLRNRGVQAESTTQFLEASRQDAERRLQEQEVRLAEFRRRNYGRLPNQAQATMQLVQTVQSQIQQNIDAANSERDRLATLESTALELSRTPAAAAAGALPAAQQLALAQENLRALQLQYKDEHPSVRAATRIIAELEAKANEEALAAPLAPELAASAPIAYASTTHLRLVDLQAQMRELQASLERRQQDDGRLRKLHASYVARIEATPAVEAELADLTRDYDATREQYQTYLQRSERARLAESLERAQIGEQFRLIDSARLPERPISPDRQRMNLLGLAAGLALGLGLIALLEYSDTRFKTDSDVLISLSLPVLAVIPAMTNRKERWDQRRRQRLMAVAASLAIVVAGATAVAWRFGVIQDWVR